MNHQDMWAILVGIEHYSSDSVPPVTGAVHDVDRMYNLLVQEMGVPPDHIMVLKNEAATRYGILHAFETHLIQNHDIHQGNPILFYFSGHGARMQAPSSWPIAWKDVHDKAREIEMILPFDAVRDPGDVRSYEETTGIPDRTLGSLLRKTAKKHGQNITVVLDCCASGHGTRHGLVAPKTHYVRSVDAGFVGRIHDDTDRDIWGDDQPQTGRRGTYLRGAFVDRQDDSHVLLAACGRREDSHGSPEGGWFTTALIEALRDPSIHPRSYAEILQHIRGTFDCWYKDFQTQPLDQRPSPQNPQCEGINRDRVVFQNTAVDRTSFPVHLIPTRPGLCTIGAGDVFGIRPGTVFELKQTSPFSSHISVLGSAIALEVSPGETVARIADGARLYGHSQGVLAYVSNVNEPLRFAVVNDNSASQPALLLTEQLNQRLEQMAPETAALCTRVDDVNKADLILRVTDDQVHLDRRDLQMSYLDTVNPHVDGSDVPRLFPDVMSWFSRFKIHLERQNPYHPFQHDVDVRLHLLQRPPDPAGQQSDKQRQDYMIPGKEISFVNHEAVVSQNESAIYCLVLENYSKYSLYPYVFLFDPATYDIQQFYAPISMGEPPLKAGGELQLGRSSESMTAISFYVQDGMVTDTGILKLYLSTEPMDLKYMEQQAVIGPDARRLPQQTRTRGGPAERSAVKGLWDVITRKITVDVRVPFSPN